MPMRRSRREGVSTAVRMSAAISGNGGDAGPGCRALIRATACYGLLSSYRLSLAPCAGCAHWCGQRYIRFKTRRELPRPTCYIAFTTKLLERALREIEQLPEGEQ